MNRRTFLKSAFIFTGALWLPKSGLLRPRKALGLLQGDPSFGAGGVTTPPSCSISNDTEIYSGYGGSHYDSSMWNVTAMKFTPAADCTITQYVVKIYNWSAGGGSITASLYTHNSGTNQPDSLITGTAKTRTPSGNGDLEFTLDTPYSSLQGSVPVWLRLTSPGGYWSYEILTKSGGRVCYGSCFDNAAIEAKVMGCVN